MAIHESPTLKRFKSLFAQLDNERQSFIAHWKDLADFVLPRRARFTISDNNKGTRINHKIIDATATLASRTLQSGMMAGLTSPARPWFRLTLPDQDLAELGAVKRWLHIVTQRMNAIFLRSNLYNTLPTVYGDMGNFGTACFYIEEDSDKVFRTYPFPVGSYYLGNDDQGRIRVFMREFRFTVRQLVMKFGSVDENGKPVWDNFSSTIKERWDQNKTEEWIEVIHGVIPNPNHDPAMSAPKFKRYLDVYYEKSVKGKSSEETDAKNVFLRESGHDFFPILAPRWEVTDGDVYGTNCPGMTALGDTKQLQNEQKRKSQAVEKGVNPAMKGPTALRAVKHSILPGDMTYTDEREGMKGFEPVHKVTLSIKDLTDDIREVKQMISRAYYEDLFLMLTRTDRREITATEVDERKEEKLLALGPVLEQTNQDMLDPLIDIVYDIMDSQGMIPQPPEELDGQELKVEYISVMAQSQKLLGINSLERFTQFSGEIAKITGDRRAFYKVNWAQIIDDHGDRSGVSPSIIRSDEEVEELVAQELEAQKQVAQLEKVQAAASVAKDLSAASLEEDSALKRLLKPQAA